jgi:hypothetical protein
MISIGRVSIIVIWDVWGSLKCVKLPAVAEIQGLLTSGVDAGFRPPGRTAARFSNKGSI